MPTRRKNTRKKVNSKNQTDPGLKLVLKRLDKIDQHLETFEQDTAAELKAVRDEMTQGLTTVRGEMRQGLVTVRGEMTQSFVNMGKTMTAEIQSVHNDLVKHYSQLDRKIDENDERYQQRHNQLLTGLDVMAKNYEQFGHDSAIIDAEHRDLKKDVETLKKRDMEKAAAIDKIEKEIDKLKAA